MKSKHTDWNINISFIIHEDFDHAWAEHYPVTLPTTLMPESSDLAIFVLTDYRRQTDGQN